MTFADLGLGPLLLQALSDKGYVNPTPIQEKAIPVVLMMRDVIGIAQTGTGKTASFTLPMIEILAGGRARVRMPRSLVLAPTRELAAQVAQNFETYGKHHNLAHVLLVGGESMAEQTKVMAKGVDVLIATPGRLLDLFERGQILLNDIKVLVIDEADRMLDMGFIPDIEKIISKIPPGSQKLLFSATMPPEIQKLAEKFLRNPKTVKVDPPASPAQTVTQNLAWVDTARKNAALVQILRNEDVKNAFIFCNRKRDIAMVAKYLNDKGFNAAPMHGDLTQPVRTKTLQDFKDGRIIMMVCSDVAARGLDVQGVSHVFNYDVPFNPEDYIHRIGRTGRAGNTGRAWTLATADELLSVRSIEKVSGRAIPIAEVIGYSVAEPRLEDMVDAPRGRGGSKGHGATSKKPSAQVAQPRHPVPSPPRLNKSKAPVKRPVVDDDANAFGDDLPAFLR